MGIVLEELADFELENGQSIQIEYNETGTIHMHINEIRVDLTPKQLKQLANLTSQADKKLKDIKDGY